MKDDYTWVEYHKLLDMVEFRKITDKWQKQEITTAKYRDLIVETIINNMAKVRKY